MDQHYSLRRKHVYTRKLAKENPFAPGEALKPVIIYPGEEDWKKAISGPYDDTYEIGLIKRNIDGLVVVNLAGGIIDIATSGNHTIAVRSAGTCSALGRDENGQCDVESWTNVKKVYAGLNMSYGIKNNGLPISAGRDGAGSWQIILPW